MANSLEEKIKNCGATLSRWASKEFGSIRKKKKELTKQLKELQQNEDMNGHMDQIRQVEQQLDQILIREETMWFQRSRAIWLKDGDKNSSFFHQKASNRKRRNTIQKTTDESGETSTKQEDIAEVIRDYFQQIYTSEGPRDLSTVLAAIECKITAEMNDTLAKPYTREEVVKTIKQMHLAKAPGPDGMTPLFFQKYWSLINIDVLRAVLGILNHGHDPTSLNHTSVVLILKVKNPETPKDFRPISLCNVVFRIITKTIANRVKYILSDVISDSQSAFIPGRAIIDNAMAAFEIFHSMKKKTLRQSGMGFSGSSYY